MVQTEAPRPKGVSLAISMASSMSLHAEEHRDRAEDLFAVDGGGARNAGEDGGLVVVAVAEHALAAGEQARRRPGVAACTCASSSSTMRGGGERADVGVVLHGVADLQRLHAGDEARLELVVDRVGDDEALGGDAGLAAVDAARADGGCDRGVEVGGRHDDEGIAAAELEHGLLDEPAGLRGDGAACGFAAGDGDGGDALVGEDVLDLARFDEQRLEGAAGKAGAADERFDGERALRDVGGVLQQADVAGHQRGREKAEDLPEGKVPRHDGEHDAERVPADVAVVVARCAMGSGARMRAACSA